MKIGVQMYTLRNQTTNKIAMRDALQFVKKNGGECVELVGFGGYSVKEIKQITDDLNLEIGSTHSPFDRMINDSDKLIDEHLQLGSNIIGLGGLPMSKYNYRNKDSLMRFCEFLNNFSSKTAKHNINVAYHNHAFEFYKINGESVLDIIINNTTENVKLCFDMFWAKVGKSSVEHYLNNNASKIAVLHFKDYSKRFWVPKIDILGEGKLDLSAIFSLAVDKQIKYAYIEHDNAKDTFKAVKTGLEKLKEFKNSIS